MSSYPLFTLGGRLQLCASMVRPGCAMADIGTDHGYLPIWLAKRGLVSRAIAADIKQNPLQKAQANIERYGVQNIVSARLSSGLAAISPEEADDIVIAGMGGEMMIEIISGAPWLKNKEKRLILQPMTSAEELRLFLAHQKFEIVREQAVQDEKRVYSVQLVQYNPQMGCLSELYPYIGKLNAHTPDNRAYIQRRVTGLRKRAQGLALSGEVGQSHELLRVIEKLQAMSEKE